MIPIKREKGKIWDKVLEDIEELEKSTAAFKKSVERFKKVANGIVRKGGNK